MGEVRERQDGLLTDPRLSEGASRDQRTRAHTAEQEDYLERTTGFEPATLTLAR
jgi:hypothetical protein